jgi:protein phosphatase
MLPIIAYGATDVGLERRNNEDAFRIAPEQRLYVVCDGMGGHASGEIASQMAVQTMVEFLTETIYRPDFRWPFNNNALPIIEERLLDTAVRLANRAIYDKSLQDARHKGMGTTVVAALVTNNRLATVHVGDSRIYRLRGDELKQLTADHSLLNHYIRTRNMSEDEVRNFKGKNVIVRAVGLRESVEPEVGTHRYEPGDLYLLCTDGLTDLVDDDTIQTEMEKARGNGGLRGAVLRLLQHALDAGGKDNVTAVLMQVLEDDTIQQTGPIEASSALDTEDTSPGFDAGPRDDETMPEYELPDLNALQAEQGKRPALDTPPDPIRAVRDSQTVRGKNVALAETRDLGGKGPAAVVVTGDGDDIDAPTIDGAGLQALSRDATPESTPQVDIDGPTMDWSELAALSRQPTPPARARVSSDELTALTADDFDIDGPTMDGAGLAALTRPGQSVNVFASTDEVRVIRSDAESDEPLAGIGRVVTDPSSDIDAPTEAFAALDPGALYGSAQEPVDVDAQTGELDIIKPEDLAGGAVRTGGQRRRTAGTDAPTVRLTELPVIRDGDRDGSDD